VDLASCLIEPTALFPYNAELVAGRSEVFPTSSAARDSPAAPIMLTGFLLRSGELLVGYHKLAFGSRRGSTWRSIAVSPARICILVGLFIAPAGGMVRMILSIVVLALLAIGISFWCIGFVSSLYGDPTATIIWYAV
jgi:hypothetical protein